MELTGEYSRMQDTFRNLSVGLVLAALLMYFLMVALDRSWVVPLTVMGTVPLALAGVLPMLYFTGSSINVQSLVGIVFSIGIKIANTILMTDLAQHLRKHEGLSPLEAIRTAAKLRVRPVTMTALAAFFALVPTAMALETGSEANAPLGRAILGGLLAGEPATLFVVPAVYMMIATDHSPHTTVKYGFSGNFEQPLNDWMGVFGRWGWNEGQHESYAYTEVDQTDQIGMGFKGERWKRRWDRAGAAPPQVRCRARLYGVARTGAPRPQSRAWPDRRRARSPSQGRARPR